MNESDFFDDHPPAGTLPRWATITQVSGFLEVPRSAVSSTVRKAVAKSEPWVKKEISEEEKLVYLIDTDHELYTSHAEQWKQRKAQREDSLNASLARWSHLRETPFSPEPSEKVALSPSPFVDIPWSEYEGFESGLNHWHRLRQWLFAKGVQIFKNVLDDEDPMHPWQWRWDDLEGDGCESEEEAIVMALQTRFHVYEEEIIELDTAFFEEELRQEESQKPPRFKLFSRKKEAPPF
jgi:hypothetical protein